MRLLAAGLRVLGWIGIKIELLILERESDASTGLETPSDAFNYRFLSTSDIDELCQLEPEVARQEIQQMFDDGKLCFGAFDADKLVAKMWCELNELYHPISPRVLASDEVYLQLAFVDPDYRGQNLAPSLRIEGYAALREIGRNKFYSYSRYFNIAARRFKEKLGARRDRLLIHIRLFNRWSRCIEIPGK